MSKLAATNIPEPTFSIMPAAATIPRFQWHLTRESTMEREYIDRAENIQKRILQLRDSL